MTVMLARTLSTSSSAGVEDTINDAAERGDLAAVQRLVQEDVDMSVDIRDAVNVKDGLLGTTPLHLAVQGGHRPVVDYLLGAGANARARDASGATPLHLAVESGSAALVEMLLSRGGQVRDVDSSGDTPLHWAASKGNVGVAAALAAKGRGIIDTGNKWGWSPLHVAARNGLAGVVDVLVREGASVGVTNDSHATPLHLACAGGQLDVIRRLLDAGASPGAVDADGAVPAALSASTAVHDLLGYTPPEGPGARLSRPPSGRPLSGRPLPGIPRSAAPSPAPAGSPWELEGGESLQDRVKREVTERRRREKMLTPDVASSGQRAAGGNSRFLKKYSLDRHNLFAP